MTYRKPVLIDKLLACWVSKYHRSNYISQGLGDKDALLCLLSMAINFDYFDMICRAARNFQRLSTQFVIKLNS